MKRFITLILMLLLTIMPVCALAAEVVDYTADFYVADYANVLDDEVEGLIVLNNDQLDKGCGAQIVVVTVDTVGSTTIENYAYTLFNEWGIGDKAKNNGLLILLAIQDGNYWLMPGKGLQDYLTAGDLDEMAAEYLLPSAQQGNYQEGVRQLFSACFEKVSIAYDADITLDDSLYYTWLQTGASGTNGSKYLSEPVREMAATAEPALTAETTAEPYNPPAEPRGNRGGFGFMHIIIILIVLIVIFGAIGTLRSRPGRRYAAPPPRRPVTPPRPPMGGYGRPAPRPAPKPAPRPPMGGGMGSLPSGGARPGGSYGGYNRPSGASRPMTGSRPSGGGITRGGGSGGSFGGSRSTGPSRPMGGSRSSGGGFGGGRSGGGGATRGGGTGGSFRGGR